MPRFRQRSPRRVSARCLLALTLFFWPGVVFAQDVPRPPCGAPPAPAYAAPAAPPNVAIWRGDSGTKGKPAYPACRGWRPGSFKLAVVLAGGIRHQGGADELLERFGRISELKKIRYWSVSDKEWRVLIDDAAALEGPDPARRRGDFALAEMKVGAALFFVQTESRLAVPVLYRMQVLELRADRIVIETENVSVVRIAFVSVMGVGDTRTVHVLERLAPDLWGYYGLALSAQDPGELFGARDASLVNRAAAVFRHFAGTPTDREPPLAP